MKIYAAYGINEFIICCGYKGYVIKEYFANYFLHHCRLPLRLKNNRMDVLRNGVEPLDRHARRHRREDDDGRAAQARRANM